MEMSPSSSRKGKHKEKDDDGNETDELPEPDDSEEVSMDVEGPLVRDKFGHLVRKFTDSPPKKTKLQQREDEEKQKNSERLSMLKNLVNRDEFAQEAREMFDDLETPYTAGYFEIIMHERIQYQMQLMARNIAQDLRSTYEKKDGMHNYSEDPVQYWHQVALLLVQKMFKKDELLQLPPPPQLDELPVIPQPLEIIEPAPVPVPQPVVILPELPPDAVRRPTPETLSKLDKDIARKFLDRDIISLNEFMQRVSHANVSDYLKNRTTLSLIHNYITEEEFKFPQKLVEFYRKSINIDEKFRLYPKDACVLCAIAMGITEIPE